MVKKERQTTEDRAKRTDSTKTKKAVPKTKKGPKPLFTYRKKPPLKRRVQGRRPASSRRR